MDFDAEMIFFSPPVQGNTAAVQLQVCVAPGDATLLARLMGKARFERGKPI